MKIRLIYLFVVTSWLFTQGCTSSRYAMAPPAEAIPLEDALLWKIEGNGLKSPSYLFGTMHLIPERDFFWPQGMEEAISNADRMVFEIDMDKMNNPLVLVRMLPKLLMKKDTTLDMLLAPGEYQEVMEAFDKNLKTVPYINKIKPFFLSQIYQLNMDENSFLANSGKKLSYEKELYQYAREYHIPSEGIETVNEQLSFFDSIPYTIQAKMLLESIQDNESKENDSNSDKLLELYSSQKIDALSSLLQEEMSNNERLHAVLLSNRNRRWIPKMERYMRKGSTFFAVGAGHLAGKNGVIPLLKAAGYKVTPISVIVKKTNRQKI